MNINIKKALGIGASVLSVVVLAIFGILGDKDDFADFLKNATDEELAAEREKVRLDFCIPNLDENYRISCRNKLSAFDAEMSKRAWGDEEPHAPSRRREHGWYLSNDD
jgi:hypothetical protein